MKSIQYTIRSISPKLDTTLRRRAKKTNKSLNEVVIETLEKGAGMADGAKFDDLDWFIGNQSFGKKSFDRDMDWLDSVPKDVQ